MKIFFQIPLCILFILAAGFSSYAASNGKAEVLVKKSLEKSQKGDFKGAIEILDSALGDSSVSGDDKRVFEWEKERLRRQKMDYSLTKDELFAKLNDNIKDLKKEEFEEWIKKGVFDMLTIDGTDFFVGSSVSNLFFTTPDIRPRRKDANFIKEKTDFAMKILNHMREAKKAYSETKNPLVLPIKVNGKMTMTPKEAMPGKQIKCWIPFPRIFPMQPQAKLISATPQFSWIDQPESFIRSVYFEHTTKQNEQPAFNLEYEYNVFSYYQDIDPAKIVPYKTDSDAFLCYMKEELPNIAFLPKFASLSKDIIADETNPYLKAKKIYNWITENIEYSYAREYSTLLCIPEITYDRKAGDCGMEGLLFITLCRMNGVAARWQSGWEFMDGSTGMHDWTEIYVEPYGWLPVDPYVGIFAISGEHNLTDDQKKELRDFYFGGLDHFRFVANKGNNQTLYPPKSDFRSDTVDFQRGEIEIDGKNLFFGEFKTSLKLTQVE